MAAAGGGGAWREGETWGVGAERPPVCVGGVRGCLPWEWEQPPSREVRAGGFVWGWVRPSPVAPGGSLGSGWGGGEKQQPPLVEEEEMGGRQRSEGGKRGAPVPLRKELLFCSRCLGWRGKASTFSAVRGCRDRRVCLPFFG